MTIIDITVPDCIDQESLRTYQACVNYMAKWVELRQFDTELDAPGIFDEFKANVCRAMLGDDTKGIG